jgi:Skp family chaperone for outer membrane proteins
VGTIHPELSMKLFVVGACLVTLTALGAAPAAAQQQGGVKLAYVNSQAILKQTPGYAQAESTFAKELEGYRSEVQKLQASMDSSASDFEQQSVMLSPTQRQAKRKDLEGQQDKLQQRTQELQQKASARERELLEPIQTKVNAVIEGLRASGNYAVIFDVSAPNSGIVTADKSLDLTARVIQQLKSGT